MGRYVDLRQDFILDRARNCVGFHGRNGRVGLLTAEQVRVLLGYAHLRHVYWLVEKGHLPYRKFGHEFVFTETDVKTFIKKRERR